MCIKKHMKSWKKLYILGCNRHTNYLHWKVTRSDNCFDQENDSTCCDATTSRQRTCSNGMTSLEKQPPLFRGHVQTQWPLRRTCNQGTVETCFDATTSIQRTLNWQLLISQEQVGGTILDLDKLKHTKLSLVCLGFTLMNVPRMLKCPGPSAFRHNQMSGVAFGGHVPWYYALSTRGQWGGTGVRSYTWVLFSGCRDPLSWTTTQV